MCDKVQHPSKRLAMQKLHNIKQHCRPAGKIPKRAYYCHECGCWHLTSDAKPFEKRNSFKNRRTDESD